MVDLITLSDKLTDLSGSELKAIIAILAEGRYLSSRDMMDITGMSRKTVLVVMESPHVKEIIHAVQDNKVIDTKRQINEIRKMLINIEKDAV